MWISKCVLYFTDCFNKILTNADDQNEFNVSRWLDVGQDDGDVVREIPVTRSEGDPIPSEFLTIQ